MQNLANCTAQMSFSFISTAQPIKEKDKEYFIPAYGMRTAQESRWAAAYLELLSYIQAVLLTGSRNEGSPSQPTERTENLRSVNFSWDPNG